MMALPPLRQRSNVAHAIVRTVMIALFACAAHGAIPWSTDYKASVAKARQEARPVIIDFTAEWCGWCKRLDEEVYADNSVATALADYICLKIDVDKQPAIALAYNVQSMPRTIIINTHGEVVGDLNGYMPLGSFLEFLEGVKDDLNRQTGGTRAPEVLDATAPAVSSPKPAAELPADGLIEMLGSPDPAARDEAARAIAEKPDRARILVAALASDYLGTRIAAVEQLKNTGAPKIAFDPWARRTDREAALAAWKEWAANQSGEGSP